MTGKLFRPKFITREFIRQHPDDLFLFGDNMQRRGFGGQAREMRGEPNSVGVPTKWTPWHSDSAYFCDDDLIIVREIIEQTFAKAVEKLYTGGNVYIPADGLGTGLSRLPEKAPKILAYIENIITTLDKFR